MITLLKWVSMARFFEVRVPAQYCSTSIKYPAWKFSKSFDCMVSESKTTVPLRDRTISAREEKTSELKTATSAISSSRFVAYSSMLSLEYIAPNRDTDKSSAVGTW